MTQRDHDAGVCYGAFTKRCLMLGLSALWRIAQANSGGVNRGLRFGLDLKSDAGLSRYAPLHLLCVWAGDASTELPFQLSSGKLPPSPLAWA